MDAPGSFAFDLRPGAETLLQLNHCYAVGVLGKPHILEIFWLVLIQYVRIPAELMVDAQHAMMVAVAMMAVVAVPIIKIIPLVPAVIPATARRMLILNGEIPHTIMADTDHFRLLGGCGTRRWVTRVGRTAGLEGIPPGN